MFEGIDTLVAADEVEFILPHRTHLRCADAVHRVINVYSESRHSFPFYIGLLRRKRGSVY